jgi:hypothetical protein
VNCKLAGTGNYYVHAVEFARELELPMERALMITALAGWESVMAELSLLSRNGIRQARTAREGD